MKAPLSVFELVLFLAVLFLLLVSLQPSFRGGYFIAVILACTTASAAYVLVRDLLRWRDDEKDNEAKATSEAETWRAIAYVMQIVIVLWLSILLFGMYLGSPLFLGWAIYRKDGRPALFKVGYALVLGTVLSLVFSQTLGMQLWTGIVPTVIPGYLGGGLLPPL